MAPQYSPGFDSVNSLKESNASMMKTGEFSTADSSVDKVSVRGAGIASPYGHSYAEYLKSALEEDLRQVALFDEASAIVIAGTLLKNKVNGLGISTGTTELSAEFVVEKEGKQLYQQTHTIVHTWKSSFIGAIAMQNALQSYPVAMSKLVSALLQDSGFRQAVSQ